MNSNPRSCECPCCSYNDHPQSVPPLNRREFLFRVGAATAGVLAMSSVDLLAGDSTLQLPVRGPKPAKSLIVRPVLTYDIAQPRPHTSWRNWGGLHTDQDVATEKAAITRALEQLKSRSDFGLEILPLLAVKTKEQAAGIAKQSYDALLVYAAGGDGSLLETMISPEKWNLMFLRHDPGPVYLWYEIVHPRFLRKTVDDYALTGLDVHDVVVDEHEELLWRLRALHGLKNTLGKRVLCIGGAGGWGAGGQKAPQISRSLWKFDLVDFPYKDLEPRLKAARADQALVRRCDAAAGRYLKESKVSLHTTRAFVNNSFVLTEVMKDIMDEARTDSLTVLNCMGTIMGMSETTACLPLSMLNDAGYLAFCESDFVVIPSGILLHYISGKPVFLNDPTFPHKDLVTLAHCTAPRKMDGKRAERTKILTHFESDYGAAPKVEMRLGQVCTNLVPDFDCKKWVGFEGTIVGNPFLDICRSQIDVKVKGDCNALLEEMKGFHWMMSYGNYLRETGYALKKLGVAFHDVSQVRTV